MLDKIKVDGKLTLMPTEAIRALICMLPMFIAAGMGKTSFLVSLGQGGFFFSTLFLPSRIAGRIIMGSLVLALGMGFYLMGGAVSPNPWVALLFTFLVCLNLSFLSGWKMGGPLALTFVMIYTAGLNTGSPEKAADNFLAFALVLGWSALISLLPFWKPIDPPKVDTSQSSGALALTFVMIYTAGLNTGSPEKAADNFLAFALVLGWSALISLLPFWKPIDPPKVDTSQSSGALAEQGLRMAIGGSLALAVSYLAGFSKLGWATSAVGNVIRYDPQLSKMRAIARMIGTIAGAILAGIALAFITSPALIVIIAGIFAVLNGLFKKTKLGMLPFFYTATILLLYTANDLSSGQENIIERVVYNTVGVVIAIIVVIYPFPHLMKKVNPKTTIKDVA